jgi:hypothetical protein
MSFGTNIRTSDASSTHGRKTFFDQGVPCDENTDVQLFPVNPRLDETNHSRAKPQLSISQSVVDQL